MPPIVRFAAPDDAAGIAEIYSPFCAADSAVSFEIIPPTVTEMRQRICKTLERFPWLVCERENVIAGYVYAGPHRERAAYQWSVEASAYIHPAHRRAGVARALYTALFALLRAQGYVTAFAGITLPNPASVALHEQMGFEPVGVYKGVGFKCGCWQDVGWWRLLLRPPPPQPSPPMGYQSLDRSMVADVFKQSTAKVKLLRITT
jgi:phosphinothricin acetyltransferase